MAVAAFPGSATVAAKTITETTASVSTPKATRPTIRRVTGCGSAALRLGGATSGASAVFNDIGSAPSGPEREVLEGEVPQWLADLPFLVAGQVGGVRVERVHEARDDVAPLSEIDALHLIEELLARAGAQRLVRFVVELRVGRVVEVRLLERGRGQERLRDLGQVGRVVVVDLRKGHFGVVVRPEERAGADLVQVHGHASRARLLLEEGRHAERARVHGQRRVEGDGQVVVVASLLQQAAG